ncbi:MAG: tripartite tricarboxylate transporter permease [Syntrophales bacterium]
MEIFDGLLLGFQVAGTPTNLFFALLGCALGTLVGVMPGLGVTGTISMCLPLVMGMNPTTAIIMFAGILSGAKFGGAVTAILMNLPGEASSCLTCLDGNALAKQGHAGKALGIAAYSSFIGGTMSTVGMVLLGPFLAAVALSFGPAEYFAMCVAGLTLASSLGSNSVAKSFLSTVLGFTLAMVGPDIIGGASRLNFGTMELLAGIEFAAVAVGLFAISEVLLTIEEEVKIALISLPKGIRHLLPSMEDVRRCIPIWIRASTLGFVVGVLPATGASICAFMSYALEKNLAKRPELFGKGAVEGVAASETADNAAIGANIAPTLTLGIPGSASTAVMMGALIMAGVRPGPMLLGEHPEVFWGVTASCFLANIMLLIINIPLIPLVVKLLKIPYYLLYILILAVSAVGVYSINGNVFDLWVMAVAGVVGYAFKKLNYPLAPVVLACVLGPIVERSLRQTMVLSRGSWGIFFERPIALILLAIAVVGLFWPYLIRLWGKSEKEQVAET